MSSEIQRIAIMLSEADWGSQPVKMNNWLVEPGETVLAGEALVELGIPGVVGDLCSPIDGRLVEICCAEDTWVTAGTIVAWVEGTTDPETAD